MSKNTPINKTLLQITFLFLISGAAGLMYEIVWERILELYFGVTMIAITLIVAAYMGGMGIGSLLGGRLARSLRFPLLAYGIIELGIAAFGIASPFLFQWIGVHTAGIQYSYVFMISFSLLLIPTCLMGMTLPILSQSFVRSVDSSGRVIGLLYGINTLGAACGSFIAAYLLIGWLGFSGTILFSALMNIVVGCAAIYLNRGTHLAKDQAPNLAKYDSPVASLPQVESPKEGTNQGGTVHEERWWGYRTILLASFIVGFIGLGLEMLWIRMLHILTKNTAYSFPTILCLFLVGLAIGGIYWGRKADKIPDPVLLFCKLELTVGIFAALSMLLYSFAIDLDIRLPWLDFFSFQQPISPWIVQGENLIFSKRLLVSGLFNYLFAIGVVILPASFFMGGGLPVLDRIAIQSPEVAGRKVGDIHLANILGSVAGTIAISFLLLSTLGSELTLKALIALGFVFPSLYLSSRTGRLSKSALDRTLIGLMITSCICILILPGKTDFYKRLYTRATGKRSEVHESGDGLLALSRYANQAEGADLWIGGEMHSYFPTYGRYEAMALICSGAAKPKQVLIIGYGGGHTTSFFQHLPGVERIVIVELLNDLKPFLEENIPSAGNLRNDPRIQYIVDDGRRYLNAHPEEKFDLISMDPLRNFTAGHNNLYSTEAMQLYRDHLSASGILCAYIDEYHVLANTITSVFPEADQFDDELIVAGNGSLRYDYPYMQIASQAFLSKNKSANDEIKGNLSPEQIMARFFRDRDDIVKDEFEMPILRDLSPWLEYYYLNANILSTKHISKTPFWIFQERIDGCDEICLSELQKIQSE